MPGASVHGGGNLRRVPLDNAPPALSQDDDSYLATRKALLITEIFIGCHQDFKPCGLGHSQRFAVLQFIPTTGASLRSA